MFEAERISGTHFEPNRLIEYLQPPFRRFELLTPMSPADAVRVLQEIVEPARIFKWPSFREHRYFEGKVAGDRFKIQRFVNYANGWLPVIEGSFRSDSSETIVAVNIRLVWPGMVFSSGIIAFLFWVCISIDSSMAGSFGARMAVLGATLCVYLFTTASFAREVRIAMKRLLTLLRPGSAFVSF